MPNPDPDPNPNQVSAQGVTQHAMIQLRFRVAWQKDAKECQKRKRGPSSPRARGA